MELNNSGAMECESVAIKRIPVSDKKTSESVDKDNHRLLFGWMQFRPQWLQGLLSAKWALFWLCWAGAVQGMNDNTIT